MSDPNQTPPDYTIAERRAMAMEQINAAAPDRDVTVIAVSKQQPDERIDKMLLAGHKTFGENRVQEAHARWGERFAARRKDLTLHLIGPLQTNKAEQALELFDVIGTIDREKLLKALVKASEKTGRRLPRLYVQVNTGEEPQKSGILPAELPAFLKYMREDYHLEPEGLMCIPPAKEAPSPHFWFLRNLAQENGVEKLSMGMSGDYVIAAKLGATSVRLGSALFGARPL